MSNTELEQIIKERNQYKSIADEAAKHAKALESIIKTELKKLESMEFFGKEYHAKLSIYDSVRINNTALKLDFPDIYSAYGKITVTEKLTIN